MGKFKMSMKLLYVQPILTSYRQDLVRRLSEEYKLTIVCGIPKQDSGFLSNIPQKIEFISASHSSIIRGKLLIQKGVIDAIKKNKPDIVLTCANMRDITYWQLLFLCRKLKIKVFSHGQGLYSKPKKIMLLKFLYRTATRLSFKYICYTSISRDSMLAAGCSPEKLVVADNSIKFSIDAESLVKRGDENGILFVGRLRDQCELENLISAVSNLRSSYPNVILHVVGSGELEASYRALFNYPWINFYGAIYDDAEIIKISTECRIGCYPGNAGLSVVHYFSLRLPPLVHDNIYLHMGPEPSYVKNNINGFTFSKSSSQNSLDNTLLDLWKKPQSEYQKISAAAFEKYKELNTPPMEIKILKILSSNNIIETK